MCLSTPPLKPFFLISCRFPCLEVRRLVTALAFCLLVPLAQTQVLEEQNYIRVDQFGYLPGKPKFAVIAKAVDGFNAGVGIDLDVSKEVELRRVSDDSVAFSELATVWNGGAADSYSGDKGWWYNFSEYDVEGEYFIRATKIGGGVVDSYAFEIGEDVYRDVLRAAVNMFYYQRAGIDKTGEYASGANWVDSAWYLGPNQDTEARSLHDESQRRDLSGGWIDAGDPNKYVTFASPAVHNLLTTFQQHPKLWEGLDLRIPESNNEIPDLLDEIKWEIDWVMKMQDYPGSGGFYNKMGIKEDTAYISPPSSDTRIRYYDEICTNATITGAGMLAHAALVFQDYAELAEYSVLLEVRAEAAWDFYKNSPNKSEQCDSHSDPEGYIEAGDADGSGTPGHYSAEHKAEAACAAVYLYALTGDEEYDVFVRQNYLETRPWKGSTTEWGVYRVNQSEAMLYYATLPKANEATRTAILEKKLSGSKSSGNAYEVVESANLYRAEATFANWGSNSLLSRQAADNLDFLNYDLKPESSNKYEERGLSIINYFHGVNPFGICYLTNMYMYGAEFSVNEMWHTWFHMDTKYDNIDKAGNVGPAPGYMSGGFNNQYSGGALMKIGTDLFSVRADSQPTQKSYTVENHWTYSPWVFNEPGLYYSASYVKALANFVDAGPRTVRDHFVEWLKEKLGDSVDTAVLLEDLDQDDDGDEIGIFEEFLYGLDPENEDEPVKGKVNLDDGTLNVALRRYNEKVASHVQWLESPDLVQWSRVPEDQMRVEDLSNLSSRLTFLTSGEGTRFLRSSIALDAED